MCATSTRTRAIGTDIQIWLLLAALAGFSQPITSYAASIEVTTSKQNYAPSEPIIVEYRNMPGNPTDWITIVPTGTTLGAAGQWAYIKERNGKKEFVGQLAGQYEVRIHLNNGKGEPEAKHVFSVGASEPVVQTPPPQPSAQSSTPVTSTAAPSLPAPPPKHAARREPSISTAKEAYEVEEPITIVFENAPGKHNDWYAIAKPGMADNVQISWSYLGGRSTGTKDIEGLEKGTYELRLFDWAKTEPLARHTFIVGTNCYGSHAETGDMCDPRIWTSKETYTSEEPIEAYFEGADGNPYDWIGVVRVRYDGSFSEPCGKFRFRAPDGQKKPSSVLENEQKGYRLFQGLKVPGTYEIRLKRQLSNENPVIIATARFEVEEPEPIEGLISKPAIDKTSTTLASPKPDSSASEKPETATALLEPEPGIKGSWLAFVRCTPPYRRREDTIQITQAFLEIKESSDSHAELYVMLNKADGLALKLSGNFDPGAQKLDLAPTEWIFKTNRTSDAVGLTAVLAPNGVILKGRMSNLPNCSEFEAFKFRRDERPSLENGLLARWEKFDRALVTTTNCAPFLKWVSGGDIVQFQEHRIPDLILDRDRFYEVMGTTYDEWSFDAKRAFQKFHSLCVQKLAQESSAKASALATEARSVTSNQISQYLTPTPTRDGQRNIRTEFAYRHNYAPYLALVNAPFYADLQLSEAEKMANTRENLQQLQLEIDAIEDGTNILFALAAQERTAQISALESRRLDISTVLIDEAFRTFDGTTYSHDLDGLKSAWEKRESIISDAATIAVDDGQMTNLRNRFDDAFSPLVEGAVDWFEEKIAGIPNTKSGAETALAESANVRSSIPKLSSKFFEPFAQASRDRALSIHERLIANAEGGWRDAKTFVQSARDIANQFAYTPSNSRANALIALSRQRAAVWVKRDLPGFQREIQTIGLSWDGLAQLNKIDDEVSSLSPETDGYAPYQTAIREKRQEVSDTLLVSIAREIESTGTSYQDIELIVQTGNALADRAASAGLPGLVPTINEATAIQIINVVEGSFDQYLDELSAMPSTYESIYTLNEQADEFALLAPQIPPFSVYEQATRDHVEEISGTLCDQHIADLKLSDELLGKPILGPQGGINIKKLACGMLPNGHQITSFEMNGEPDKTTLKILQADEQFVHLALHNVEALPGQMMLVGYAAGDANSQSEISVDDWEAYVSTLMRPRPTGVPDLNGVTACDRLAAEPDDPHRVADGASFDAMDPDAAIQACTLAVEYDPENTRLLFQFGRALLAAGADAESAEVLKASAEAGYAAAAGYMGDLLFKDDSTDQEYQTAMSYYRQAASGGYGPAKEIVALGGDSASGLDGGSGFSEPEIIQSFLTGNPTPIAGTDTRSVKMYIFQLAAGLNGVCPSGNARRLGDAVLLNQMDKMLSNPLSGLEALGNFVKGLQDSPVEFFRKEMQAEQEMNTAASDAMQLSSSIGCNSSEMNTFVSNAIAYFQSTR